jgi:hypothetical protein
VLIGETYTGKKPFSQLLQGDFHILPLLPCTIRQLSASLGILISLSLHFIKVFIFYKYTAFSIFVNSFLLPSLLSSLSLSNRSFLPVLESVPLPVQTVQGK